MRTAMSVGQASGLALAEAAAAGCEVVQYTPNQVKEAVAGWGGGRQGAGAEDGAGPPRPRRAAPAGRRRRRRRPRPVPPGRRPVPGAASAAVRPMIGSLRGTVLERGADAEVLARGARRRLPGHRHAPHAGRARRRRRGASSTSTTTSARTPRRCTASRARRAGVLRGAARRPRRRSGAGPGHPRHPRPGRAAPAWSPTATSAALSLVPGVGQEDGRAPAARAEEPPRRARASTVVVPAARQRRRPTARSGRCARGARRPRLRRRGDPRGAARAARRRRRRRRCCATPSKVLGAGVRDEFLDPAAGDRRAEPSRPGCGPAASTSSSARRELKEHLAVDARGGPRAAARPPTTCCSPARPGLGKTTLAGIVAAEMGVQLHVTSGPALERAGDLAAILTKLDEGDVLFIDEIHRLSRAVEEILYPAMEDFQLDIVVGKGPAASSIRLTLPALHARRRHDPHGPDHRSAAGPLRARRPARLLRRRASCRPSSIRAAGILGVQIDDEGAAGDRPAEPGHAPHRQPPAAPRARLRRGARRRCHRRRHRPRRAGAVRRRRARPRQGRPRHPRRRCAAVQRRPRRAVDAGHQRG